jgi:hypothetical protein
LTAAIGGATQRDAVAAGLILDAARHTHAAQARYVGTLGGPEWTSYLGERVITLSGLSPWTQGGKHAFGLAFAHSRRQREKELGGDPRCCARSLSSTASPRQLGYHRQNGDPHRRKRSGLLRPQEIAQLDPRFAERYLGMILSETEYAVPSGNAPLAHLLVDQNQPGTVSGEILRGFAQFKSFGAVYAMLHGQRIAAMLTTRKPAGSAPPMRARC